VRVFVAVGFIDVGDTTGAELGFFVGGVGFLVTEGIGVGDVVAGAVVGESEGVEVGFAVVGILDTVGVDVGLTVGVDVGLAVTGGQQHVA